MKEEFAKHEDRKGYLIGDWEDIIDNAPTIKQKVMVIEPDIIEKLADSVVDVISKIDWDKAIEAYKERPHGEWIKETSGYYIYFRCSNPNCNNFVSNPTRFCSNCGAKMTKEANNE